MIKVLFVCLGNICRSPMAEGVFNLMLAEGGLSGKIESDSAGTSAYHIGALPDERMCKTASKNGIHLTHRARKLEESDLFQFDYVIAMDSQNLKNIQTMANPLKEVKAKVFLMREFDSLKDSESVPDPYYGGMEGFDIVYQILNRSCKNLIDFIRANHQC